MNAVDRVAPPLNGPMVTVSQGSGADITFFEYPGARRGRAGAGMVHTVVWRVGRGEALDFWAAGPAAADGVFRPAWCAATSGRTELPAESPPLGRSGAIMVLLAGPDGREVWSRV